MSRGDRNPKFVIEQRRKEVAALALAGLSVDEIAQQRAVHRATIFRDIANLDLAADSKTDAVELRVRHRTTQLQKLAELEKVVAESQEMGESEKVAAFLQIADRRIRLLCLDSEELLPGSENGAGGVVVNINVEFE